MSDIETVVDPRSKVRYVIIELAEPSQIQTGDEIWVQDHNCWMSVQAYGIEFTPDRNDFYYFHGQELLDGPGHVAKFKRFDLIPKVARWVEAR